MTGFAVQLCDVFVDPGTSLSVEQSVGITSAVASVTPGEGAHPAKVFGLVIDVDSYSRSVRTGLVRSARKALPRYRTPFAAIHHLNRFSTIPMTALGSVHPGLMHAMNLHRLVQLLLYTGTQLSSVFR